MATSSKRAYAGKDVELLIVCATIIEHAIAHQTFLVSKRAVWADPFFPDIKRQIQTASTDFLGTDNALQLREATQIVTRLQNDALNDLAEFKVQIMEDFKSNKPRRSEILNRLGFKTHYKDAQHRDQEALIELLLKFKLNMSRDLQSEITHEGTSETTINNIIGYADVLETANITQETLKGTRKEITQEAITAFNAIYEEVISIAKIATNFFKDDKAVKDKFSYAIILAAMNR